MNTYNILDYGVRANSTEPQTKQIQAVLDMCKNGGGKVVFPEGVYNISSLRLWSDMTIYLEKGAKIIGSKNCEDYATYDLGEDFIYYTDSEAFAHIRGYRRPATYRRAMFSAFGEENISIIGETDCLIDGMHCYDAGGEENFRGPHGIFMSSCKNISFSGYTIQNNGNFMHQLDNCENVQMENIVALAGHDGVHLHCCKNMKVKNCTFITGDDCVAGANVSDVTISGCKLNTSCNTFRIGGKNVLIENCTAEGPGYYPHLLSVVKGPEFAFKRTDGRHNTVSFLRFFASRYFESKEIADITVRNCTVKDVDRLMIYNVEEAIQQGQILKEITFENVTATGLKEASVAYAGENSSINLVLKNTTMEFEGQNVKEPFITDKPPVIP